MIHGKGDKGWYRFWALILVSANVSATSVAYMLSVNAAEAAPTISAIDGFCQEWPK